jgi:hypothetical protein
MATEAAGAEDETDQETFDPQPVHAELPNESGRDCDRLLVPL